MGKCSNNIKQGKTYRMASKINKLSKTHNNRTRKSIQENKLRMSLKAMLVKNSKVKTKISIS